MELCGECTSTTDGYTLPFRRGARTQGGIRSECNCSLLKDSRNRTKATNILSEDRFARARHQLHINEQSTTLATNHFLAEFKALHQLALNKFEP